MKGPTQELLNFVMGTHFENLPPEVVHESKRLILDSIGISVAALKVDKGRYGMALAKRLGGPPESAILGTSDRVSCSSAAFANGELMNALDYDVFILPTHAPPALIPATLALGECVGASGKDTILAIALGCELSIRLGKAIRGLKKIFTEAEESEVGKIPGTKYSVSVLGVAAIAGVAGAGKVMKFDQQKMSHAVGLAAHFAPFPQAKWKTFSSMPMTKYLSAGWTSMAEVVAVLLAEMGYTADTTFLDGDLGFWRFFGGDSWDPEVLTEKFGREWKMLKALEFKPYPCCRDFHVPLDCFIKIINENKLMAGEVERVRIQTHPLVTGSFYTNKVIKDHITAQFSLPYVIAVAANRVNLPEWQDPGTLKDPQILNFMDKVFIEAHPNFIEVQLKEPLSNMTIVEVITKNRTFKEEGKYTKGLPEPEFSRMSDEELVEKFKLNVSKVLPQYKISKAIENITVLENVKNISEVVEQVTL